MKHLTKTMVLAVSGAVIAFAIPGVAQTKVQQADPNVVEEVVTIGTRSIKPRSVTDSPVPVDVLSAEEFTSLGNTADITDNLKALIPSYNAAPATGDGSAFIRPTSLRGMSPDQTLVLVNGKRRHRSALVQFFAPAAGNGSHGVDVGLIPSIALKSVEVLRDGAAAQYGSDAIAGVMNFNLKDADEGGKVILQYGEFQEGEESVMFAANGGFSIGGKGFVNLSFEATDNEALSRGEQVPAAQDLIDAGVQGVGSDAVFGDAPFAQTWGRPETEAQRFFANFGYDINDTTDFYGHLGYAESEGRYRFFYRPGYDLTPDSGPVDCSTARQDIFNIDGNSLCEAGFVAGQPGFTPFLDGDQEDTSLVLGIKGEFGDEIYYDYSIGYGVNELDYFLNNTAHPFLVDASVPTLGQRDFVIGGYEQEELNFNADFSKALSQEINLAGGFEWREETFTTVPGEPAAYTGGSPSGMSSVNPADAGDFDRDNWALYVDVEQDISDAWLMQYALRYEDFSDFGSTTNGKIASRYKVTDFFTLRGALSTGFHAPTPGQANITSIITTADGMGGLREQGLVSPTSEEALRNGGSELTEEESTNISIGFTSDIGDNTTLTVDYYLIEVDNRIYRSQDIDDIGADLVAGTDDDGEISFFTNALDVKHRGIDLVLTSSVQWSSSVDTAISFGFSYTQTDVTGQDDVITPTGPVSPVSDGLVEQIENDYPNEKFVLTTNTRFGDQWNWMLRFNYFGEHFDERGRIGGVDGADPSLLIGDIIYVDTEIGFDITENFNIALGGSNIFDEYIDEARPPFANRIGNGLPYPRRAAANYEGASYYLRTSYSF